MGGICCKIKTEEGLVYQDEDLNQYKDFYREIPPCNPNEKEKALQDTNNINMMNDNYLQDSYDNKNIEKAKANIQASVISDELLDSQTKVLDNKKILKSNEIVKEEEPVHQIAKSIRFINQKAAKEEVKKETNGMSMTNQCLPILGARLLKLTIKESKFNNIGQVLEINNQGLTGSIRKANDGSVFFGQSNPDQLNDFILQSEEGINLRHFEIKYEPIKNEYIIKNISGSGVFIKIDKPMILKSGMIISFGTNHILVKITNETIDQQEIISKIKFKGIYGPNKGNE